MLHSWIYYTWYNTAIIEINGQLQAAEQTEEWDVQKLRGHVMLLSRHLDYMTPEMAARYEAIRKRLENTLRTLQGLHRIS